MAALYANENFDNGVVQALRAMGHDVLTVQEAGEQGRDDAFWRVPHKRGAVS